MEAMPATPAMTGFGKETKCAASPQDGAECVSCNLDHGGSLGRLPVC